MACSADPGRQTHPSARRLAAGLAAVLALALAPAAAHADLFSPGPLARGHEALEGLSHCTDCHAAGQKLSQERCLTCHVELKDRVAKGEGYHGRLPPAERACESCHHEHQGRDAPLVEWGPGGRDRFDHARTGAPLKGKHARVACARCHDPRLVVDHQVRTILAKRPGRTTLLGLPVACSACHFDEHRGQTPGDCRRCHDEQGWKPARGFDHARTAYPLTGKHAKVDCARCHPRREDDATAAGTFPAPLGRSFASFKPLPHARCLDCHRKDPHEGRFGESCESCHQTSSWKDLGGRGKENAFHAKTRYPLLGAHLEVSCKACHGPHGAEKARFKGLPFQACTDCHADAHVGQLARAGRPAPGCDRCHVVQGWVPARYELEQHAQSTYPLAGAHRAVACTACHPRDERLGARVAAGVRSRLAAQGRPVKVSPAVLARSGAERCESCHRDPHAGQLKGRTSPSACPTCHQVAAWSALTFDHARDSRFPLVGKHAKAACAACHPRRGDEPVRYRPLDVACAACHADPHAGQLARRRPSPGARAGAAAAGGASDCARCHDETSWKASRFVHAPPFTTYRLRGKHAPLRCEACHRKVLVVGSTPTVRYRPLPTTCEGCHADFHKGAFRGFEP
jgi:hypothetical protein